MEFITINHFFTIKSEKNDRKFSNQNARRMKKLNSGTHILK
jgi:hypothetical protein